MIQPTELNRQPQRSTQTRIRIQIPRHYYQEPILSGLISRHQLKVNIVGALLASNAQESGWFDLELEGTPQQIDSGLAYLSELDVDIWHQSQPELDGW